MAIQKNTNYMTIQNKKTVNQVFKEAGFLWKIYCFCGKWIILKNVNIPYRRDEVKRNTFLKLLSW